MRGEVTSPNSGIRGKGFGVPLDYSVEAGWYDQTRGGEERAEAAAAAVAYLVSQPGVLLDVAGGTGIVGDHMAQRGHQVIVTDLVVEMLRQAHLRLPGQACVMDAGNLAVAESSVDTVTMIWFLHLLPHAGPQIAEAARVLKPGGYLVTTVDKHAANGMAEESPTDARDVVIRLAAESGLRFAGETCFAGVGQRGEPRYPLIAFVALGKC
jgi:septum formation protein